MSYKLTNIANDRIKGALFDSTIRFGSTHTPYDLRLEPTIGNRLLKLYSTAILTDEEYTRSKVIIDIHTKGKVIEVLKIEDAILEDVSYFDVSDENEIISPNEEISIPKVEEEEVKPLKKFKKGQS